VFSFFRASPTRGPIICIRVLFFDSRTCLKSPDPTMGSYTGSYPNKLQRQAIYRSFPSVWRQQFLPPVLVPARRAVPGPADRSHDQAARCTRPVLIPAEVKF
jgi:hypothetical protein